MQIEEIDGVVCIDGKSVVEHMRHFNARPCTLSYIAIYADRGGTNACCGTGLLAAIQVGNLAVASGMLHRAGGGGYDSENKAAARLTGLPLAQIIDFEAGWCSFALTTSKDPDMYRLGNLARHQCESDRAARAVCIEADAVRLRPEDQ
jgi:hypothetical protein